MRAILEGCAVADRWLIIPFVPFDVVPSAAPLLRDRRCPYGAVADRVRTGDAGGLQRSPREVRALPCAMRSDVSQEG